MENIEQPDDRELEVLRRLNDFYLSASLGDYFRSRVHGWLCVHSGEGVALPEELLERLGRRGVGARIVPAASTPNQLAIDAFAMAYHSSETYCRQLLAILNGTGARTSPALALKVTPTGRTFSESLAKIVATDADLDAVTDFVFMPPEVQEELSDDEVASCRNFLRLWTRRHVNRLEAWKNPNNAFKHGLAATAPPTQMAFLPAPMDHTSTAHAFMDGPVLHTLEHEVLRGGDGSKSERLSWWHRALDPMELIADVLTTAEILDWLREVCRGRLLGEPVMVPVKSGPLPPDLRKAGPPGISFRLDVGAVPMALDPDDVERMNTILDSKEVAGPDDSSPGEPT